MKTKKSEKINRSQTENLSAMTKAEVTVVPMQNQKPADLTNRIESKVEVRTKIHPQRGGKKRQVFLI